MIRRELNHLPDLLISDNFLLFNQSYDWWEDGVLLVVYLLIVGFLIYSWRYCWALLSRVPVSLYLSIAALAILQYMGENNIIFSEPFGPMLEELTEAAVYCIALVYLWQFKLVYFEVALAKNLESAWQNTSKQRSKS